MVIHMSHTYFNFPPALISLFMSCVSTSSISILFSGMPTHYFLPTRGIRQGDPLSLYLFILCMEMLTRSIERAVDYNQQSPITLSRSCPRISHLLFTDDIILTSKLTTTSCHSIIDTLIYFTNLAKQKINFHKSKIFFSKNCSPSHKEFVLSSFNMSEGKSFGRYLGFPIFLKRPMQRDFQFFLDNFKLRLADWKTHCLTMAGRATLIKSTLNSLSNYTM